MWAASVSDSERAMSLAGQMLPESMCRWVSVCTPWGCMCNCRGCWLFVAWGASHTSAYHSGAHNQAFATACRVLGTARAAVWTESSPVLRVMSEQREKPHTRFTQIQGECWLGPRGRWWHPAPPSHTLCVHMSVCVCA